jgi:hypothetical protein
MISFDLFIGFRVDRCSSDRNAWYLSLMLIETWPFHRSWILHPQPETQTAAARLLLNTASLATRFCDSVHVASVPCRPHRVRVLEACSVRCVLREPQRYQYAFCTAVLYASGSIL